MTKKILNQNANYTLEIIRSVEEEFTFEKKPINRFQITNGFENDQTFSKRDKLDDLKKKVDSIDNCNLKNHSKKIIMGSGELNSPIMIIGEAPGLDEENSGLTFEGNVGQLLEKMLSAIEIQRKKIYTTYSVNFRPPNDRKPSSSEIKRYSIFLKEHISIIDPKILILMGSTAMEAITGFNGKISNERGQWKEIILKNKTYPLIITYISRIQEIFMDRFERNKKQNSRFKYKNIMRIVAGVDEVGRGSLIGPVYAAAVILNKSIDVSFLKDSKKLKKNEREILSKLIKRNSVWAIGRASVKEIEKMNILNASLLAMERALRKLKKKPTLVLIDGNKIPLMKNYKLIPIIKGDTKIPSISAASIIAKVSRDKQITKLSEKFKDYDWDKNFGYGTKHHLKAIKNVGITSHHRRTFSPINKMK